MSISFGSIVEQVQTLSSLEMEELRDLLEKYLIEERRAEIYRNYRQSLKEHRAGKLRFSSKIDDLKKALA